MMTTLTSTLESLVRGGSLRMTHGGRKYVPGYDDAEGWEHYRTRCRLTFRDREMRVTFRQGVGHIDPPRTVEVINGVLCDARCVLPPGETIFVTFEEWCGEFGCDTDSRKAEASYLACKAQTVDVRHLLGPEYDVWVEAEGL